MVADYAAPFSDSDIEALFAPWLNEFRIAVAVSGGRDSMALLLMLLQWQQKGGVRQNRPPLLVFTVDHGLRREAKEETLQVSQWCRLLGVDCFILSAGDWEEVPRSNIQQKARRVRYRLLTEACYRHGIKCLFTAHHLQDQAETVLLRLMRGSGVDGLAAMEIETRLMGVRLCRPLLDVPPERLALFLSSRGQAFISDPSNDERAFLRVRVRDLLSGLVQEGLTLSRLADTARRMRRAQYALKEAADHLFSEAVCLDPRGFCTLNRAVLKDVPDELFLRVLILILQIIGGNVLRPRACKSENLALALRRGETGYRTLHGCRLALGQEEVIVWREIGRVGLPVLRVNPGDNLLWDGRFHIRLHREVPEGVDIMALGKEGWAQIKAMGQSHGLPAVIGQTCPSVWRNGHLLGSPVALSLGQQEGLDISFLGLDKRGADFFT